MLRQNKPKSIISVALFPLTCFWEDIAMNCCFRRKPRAHLWTVSRMNLCKMPMKILPVKTWGVWVSCEQRKRHHVESLKYQARKMTNNQMKHPTEQDKGGLRDRRFWQGKYLQRTQGSQAGRKEEFRQKELHEPSERQGKVQPVPETVRNLMCYGVKSKQYMEVKPT